MNYIPTKSSVLLRVVYCINIKCAFLTSEYCFMFSIDKTVLQLMTLFAKTSSIHLPFCHLETYFRFVCLSCFSIYLIFVLHITAHML